MTHEAWVNGVEGEIVTEQNATVEEYDTDKNVYDMFRDRHVAQGALSYDVAVRDIIAGEEILCNYIFYENTYETAVNLKSVCSGEDVGVITKSEVASKGVSSIEALDEKIIWFF